MKHLDSATSSRGLGLGTGALGTGGLGTAQGLGTAVSTLGGVRRKGEGRDALLA